MLGLELIAVRQQSPRNHLRLDFGGTLENIEDACVAKHSADRVFQRVAIAAVDLQRIVGRGPCRLRAQKLGQTSFQIAASIGVFLARCEKRQLPCDHRLDGHPGQLLMDTREGVECAAELLALLSIGATEIERIRRDTDSPSCGLNPRALERRHQLFEAFTLDTAQEVVGGHFEAIERKRKFLHATIAEDPRFRHR